MNTLEYQQNTESVETKVRQAIVRSYRRGVYDSRIIAASLNQERMERAEVRWSPVGPEMIRDVRRRERAAIESDLAALLANPGADTDTLASAPWNSTKFGVIYCLSAARDRLRLALWVDRLDAHPA